MNPEIETFRRYSIVNRLADARTRRSAQKQELLTATEQRRSDLFDSLRKRRDVVLSEALAAPEGVHLGQAAVVIAEAEAYAKRCDWNWVDLSAFLACAPESSEETLEALAAAGLVYQAFRMIDDVIDRHLDYKGGYATLLGVLSDGRCTNPDAGALLPAILVLMDVIVGHRLSAWAVDQARRTVFGALEESSGSPSDLSEYDTIVSGKMVAYGFLLFAPALQALDAEASSNLEPFFTESFRVSQIANDLQDIAEDRLRDQPNFWLLFESPDQAEKTFLERFDRLEQLACRVPDRFLPYTNLRVHDIAVYFEQVLGS